MSNQTFVYNGVTEWASSEAETLGISDGTAIQVTCAYDLTLVPGIGQYAWETNQGQNGSVEIKVGYWTMPPDGDSSGSPNWPVIQFDAWQFAGVNYVGLYVLDNNQYQFTAQGAEWSISILGAQETQIASGRISTQASESAAGAEPV